MKLRNIMILLLVIGLFLLSAPLWATPPDCPPGHDNIGSCNGGNGGGEDEEGFSQDQSQEQGQSQGQEQGQEQEQSQEQTAEANAVSEAQASNEGNSQSVQFSYPQRVPATYLNLSNNTESCVRVLGFSFANTSGSGMVGMPLPRGKACDMWKAVNEAQENGHIALSYAFMCEIRNIRKVWGLERCKELTEAALQSLEDMTTSHNFEPEPSLVMAQVSQEEFDEQQQLVEDRFAQYENLIGSLKADDDDKDAEIERLKREAAAMREKQAQEDARRQLVLQKLAEKKGEKGDSK